MARRYAEGNGHSQVADNSRDDLLQSVTLICGLHAVQHFAEDDAADLVETTGQLQLHQHAVDLKGLGGNVFEEQNRAGGFDFVGRAERRDQDRETSAV